MDKEIVKFSEEAKSYLLDSLKNTGKNCVRLGIAVYKDSEDNIRYKYNLEAVLRPDQVIELEDGYSLILDGNSYEALVGTEVTLDDVKLSSGEEVKGFKFT